MEWVREITTVNLFFGYAQESQKESLKKVNELLNDGWRIIHIAQNRMLNPYGATPGSGQGIEQTYIILGK